MVKYKNANRRWNNAPYGATTMTAPRLRVGSQSEYPPTIGALHGTMDYKNNLAFGQCTETMADGDVDDAVMKFSTPRGAPPNNWGHTPYSMLEPGMTPYQYRNTFGRPSGSQPSARTAATAGTVYGRKYRVREPRAPTGVALAALMQKDTLDAGRIQAASMPPTERAIAAQLKDNGICMSESKQRQDPEHDARIVASENFKHRGTTDLKKASSAMTSRNWYMSEGRKVASKNSTFTH